MAISARLQRLQARYRIALSAAVVAKAQYLFCLIALLLHRASNRRQNIIESVDTDQDLVDFPSVPNASFGVPFD